MAGIGLLDLIDQAFDLSDRRPKLLGEELGGREGREPLGEVAERLVRCCRRSRERYGTFGEFIGTVAEIAAHGLRYVGKGGSRILERLGHAILQSPLVIGERL